MNIYLVSFHGTGRYIACEDSDAKSIFAWSPSHNRFVLHHHLTLDFYSSDNKRAANWRRITENDARKLIEQGVPDNVTYTPTDSVLPALGAKIDVTKSRSLDQVIGLVSSTGGK